MLGSSPVAVDNGTWTNDETNQRPTRKGGHGRNPPERAAVAHATSGDGVKRATSGGAPIFPFRE